MQQMVKLLHERVLKYNWVGFYMLEPGAQPPMLVLGAFEGAMYEARGYYRPEVDCIMFSRNVTWFCAVCRRALTGILDLYST